MLNNTVKTNPERYRDGLPPIPTRLLRLPVERGYPVPWFCANVDGKRDFRVTHPDAPIIATRGQICWICGERLSGRGEGDPVFVVGPMCTVNCTSAEPPSHHECATWAVQACPFLNQVQHVRREGGLPPDVKEMPGMAIWRQPGAIALWQTRSWEPFRAYAGNDGLLFKFGEPSRVEWYSKGRPATRQEVVQSFESGFPALRDMAIQQDREEGGKNQAVLYLALQLQRAWHYLPDGEREDPAELLPYLTAHAELTV